MLTLELAILQYTILKRCFQAAVLSQSPCSECKHTRKLIPGKSSKRGWKKPSPGSVGIRIRDPLLFVLSDRDLSCILDALCHMRCLIYLPLKSKNQPIYLCRQFENTEKRSQSLESYCATVKHCRIRLWACMKLGKAVQKNKKHKLRVGQLSSYDVAGTIPPKNLHNRIWNSFSREKVGRPEHVEDA